ncbi:MAG: LysM peptidoglycan-binding domain-containing protein [Clostridia bacterium]|nr:LysM peptidoglycan-binding domain-containing protein [Clostridia bacterium]
MIKPNNPEDHSVLVETEMEIFCKVFEEKQINIIQDMYSPSKNISFEENKINTMVNLKNSEETINIRDKVKLEDTEYANICDVEVIPEVTEVSTSKDKVRYTGDLRLKFILANTEEDNVITLNKNLPFDFSGEIEGLMQDSKINFEIVPISREFVQDGMDINVKVDLRVNTNSYNLETVNVIDNIDETEEIENNPYSMVIYFVKPGDTLWKIAKKYKSTVQDIARINNIENPDKIDVGMQLFIPKCSICRT